MNRRRPPDPSLTPEEAIARKKKIDGDFVAAERKVLRMVELAASITNKLAFDASQVPTEEAAARLSDEAASELTEYYELIESVRSMLRQLEPRSTDLEIRRTLADPLLKEYFDGLVADCERKFEELLRCPYLPHTGDPTLARSATAPTS